MNILPYHIHHILKIYQKPAATDPLPEKRLERDKRNLPEDRVEISEEGRKEQIRKQIVTDIVKKIR